MLDPTSLNSSVVDMSSSVNRSLQPKYKVGLSSIRMNKTASSANSSKGPRSYNLVSVFEGKGPQKGQIGMAVMDVRFPVVHLFEFIDSNSYIRLSTRLHVEEPVEVIVADSLNERKTTMLLVEAIKNSTQDATTITTVHKRYFCENRGTELVKELANAEVSACGDNVRQFKKLCMAACAALLKYIEFIQNMTFAPFSLKIIYRDLEKICLIDVASWKCLELLDNTETSTNSKARRSLLSVINYTVTAGGFRLLRSNLLQPLADKAEIEARLDAVEELCGKANFLDRVRDVLSRIHEMDDILSICAQSSKEEDVKQCEASIVQLLRLKQTMEVIEPLRHALSNAKCDILKDMQEKLSDKRVDRIFELLDNTLNSEVLAVQKRNSLTLRNQKCYAVKEGICVNLDVARKAYEEILNDLQSSDTTAELEEHLPNQNVRLAYSLTRGFHYVWVVANAARAHLPTIFIQDIRNRSSITFTSKKLVRYNDRIDQCVAEVIVASNVVIQSLIEQVRDSIPVLYYIMETTTNLDFLASLAIYSTNTHTARPHVTSTLLFKEGRHPLLDYHLQDKCVANDTFLTQETNFAIITGPNMAGKSTHLRQVCQLSVLTQLGSWIPADVASVPVFTRIFSRVGHNDDLSNELSAFAIEMGEMVTIMNFASSHSLIVIDELARSTCSEEGVGISYAIAEYLLKQKSFVLLATHFLDIASLDHHYIAVENFHFHPQTGFDEHGREIYNASHKLYKGPYAGPLYGFDLAELTTFPAGIIRNAKKMAQRIKNSNEKRGQVSSESATRRLLVRTALKLRQAVIANDGAIPDEKMIKHFLNIRKSMRRGIGEIEEMQQQEAAEREDALLTEEFEDLPSQQQIPPESEASDDEFEDEEPPSSPSISLDDETE